MLHLSLNVASRGLGCLLAMFLLLSPVCEGWCRSQVCGEKGYAAEKSPCHDTASEATDPAGGSIHAVRNCGLREFPAVLSLNSREIAPRLEAATSLRDGRLSGAY